MNQNPWTDMITCLDVAKQALKQYDNLDEIARLQISSMGLCYVHVGERCIFCGGLRECAAFLTPAINQTPQKPKPPDIVVIKEGQTKAK